MQNPWSLALVGLMACQELPARQPVADAGGDTFAEPTITVDVLAP